jgi:hypothetical protein
MFSLNDVSDGQLHDQEHGARVGPRRHIRLGSAPVAVLGLDGDHANPHNSAPLDISHAAMMLRAGRTSGISLPFQRVATHRTRHEGVSS